ncbi:MAG: G5 domain-containing protein [Ignavibacteriales bacterium]|nr:G5 domain-containing protein [Ignavibacteriales bacterium]
MRNESLPDGETRLVQAGVNGLQELTYRIVLENGEEISRSPSNPSFCGRARGDRHGRGAGVLCAAAHPRQDRLPRGRQRLADRHGHVQPHAHRHHRRPGRAHLLPLPKGDYLVFTRKSTKSRRQGDQHRLVGPHERRQARSPPASPTSSTTRSGSPAQTPSRIPRSSRAPPRPAGRRTTTCSATALPPAPRRGSLDASSGGVYGWWGSVVLFFARMGV